MIRDLSRGRDANNQRTLTTVRAKQRNQVYCNGVTDVDVDVDVDVEGQFTDFFFSYTSLKIIKKSHTKITKSQKNHIQIAPKITNH